jgi:hypothetical protein
MTTVAIILAHDGSLDAVLSNSEVDVLVFKKGVDDDKIDVAERTLDEVDVSSQTS